MGGGGVDSAFLHTFYSLSLTPPVTFTLISRVFSVVNAVRAKEFFETDVNPWAIEEIQAGNVTVEKSVAAYKDIADAVEKQRAPFVTAWNSRANYRGDKVAAAESRRLSKK